MQGVIGLTTAPAPALAVVCGLFTIPRDTLLVFQ
jgi:hypothetical protein